MKRPAAHDYTPNGAPIPRRTRAPVGPDAVDWAVMLAGAVLFVAVMGSACALLFVVAALLGKG